MYSVDSRVYHMYSIANKCYLMHNIRTYVRYICSVSSSAHCMCSVGSRVYCMYSITNKNYCMCSEIQPPAKVAVLNNSASVTFATQFTGGGSDDVVVFSSFMDACTALINADVDSFVAEENTLKACFVSWQQAGKATGGLVISSIAEQVVETYYAVYNDSTACAATNTVFFNAVTTTLESGVPTQEFVTQNYSTLASGTNVPRDAQSVSFSPIVIAASVFCVLATAVGTALVLVLVVRLLAWCVDRGKYSEEMTKGDHLHVQLLPQSDSSADFRHLPSAIVDQTKVAHGRTCGHTRGSIRGDCLCTMHLFTPGFLFCFSINSW